MMAALGWALCGVPLGMLLSWRLRGRLERARLGLLNTAWCGVVRERHGFRTEEQWARIVARKVAAP